ncbi:hypothetical protein DDW44_22560 [Streptomyces tirandamycinicus]|uniref:Uncharacterized protein n=1 Tax=Streptomyces tirandamycinicus TaxID=2174846 RepID=A0A2S1SXZ8_9ACTN|nr:hypothetical protein DDW44_22560 [Streptomyces tirandamycinicus]
MVGAIDSLDDFRVVWGLGCGEADYCALQPQLAGPVGGAFLQGEERADLDPVGHFGGSWPMAAEGRLLAGGCDGCGLAVAAGLASLGDGPVGVVLDGSRWRGLCSRCGDEVLLLASLGLGEQLLDSGENRSLLYRNFVGRNGGCLLGAGLAVLLAGFGRAACFGDGAVRGDGDGPGGAVCVDCFSAYGAGWAEDGGELGDRVHGAGAVGECVLGGGGAGDGDGAVLVGGELVERPCRYVGDGHSGLLLLQRQ